MGVSSGLWLRERELRRMDKLCQGQVNLHNFFIQLFLHEVFKLATEHLYTINVYTSTKMAWLDPSVCKHLPHTITLTPSPTHILRYLYLSLSSGKSVCLHFVMSVTTDCTGRGV